MTSSISSQRNQKEVSILVETSLKHRDVYTHHVLLQLARCLACLLEPMIHESEQGLKWERDRQVERGNSTQHTKYDCIWAWGDSGNKLVEKSCPCK